MDKNNNAKQKYSEFDSEIIPHIRLIKKYAFLLTRNYNDAEDLLQDTMLKAFRFFDNYEKGSNAKAWLLKIMQNSFINGYRRKVKEPFKVDYDDVQNFYEKIRPEDIKAKHYQHDAFNNVLDDEISKALSFLPDDFRTIIILSDIEGYSYKEIADFTDCPVGTVRSRLHRTRKILFTQLYNYAQKNGYIRSQFESEDKYDEEDFVERNAMKKAVSNY